MPEGPAIAAAFSDANRSAAALLQQCASIATQLTAYAAKIDQVHAAILDLLSRICDPMTGLKEVWEFLTDQDEDEIKKIANDIRVIVNQFTTEVDALRQQIATTLTEAETILTTMDRYAEKQWDHFLHHTEVGRAINQVGQFGKGVGEEVGGLVEDGWTYGPIRAYVDPQGWYNSWTQMIGGMAPLVGLGGEHAPGVAQAWKDLGKNAVHWDEWSTNPAEAAGKSTFDLASLFVPGGGEAAAASKGARAAADGAEAAAKAAPKAAALPRALGDLAKSSPAAPAPHVPRAEPPPAPHASAPHDPAPHDPLPHEPAPYGSTPHGPTEAKPAPAPHDSAPHGPTESKAPVTDRPGPGEGPRPPVEPAPPGHGPPPPPPPGGSPPPPPGGGPPQPAAITPPSEGPPPAAAPPLPGQGPPPAAEPPHPAAITPPSEGPPPTGVPHQSAATVPSGIDHPPPDAVPQLVTAGSNLAHLPLGEEALATPALSPPGSASAGAHSIELAPKAAHSAPAGSGAPPGRPSSLPTTGQPHEPPLTHTPGPHSGHPTEPPPPVRPHDGPGGSGDQPPLESQDPTVVDPEATEGDRHKISGHGGYNPADGHINVPRGTTITVYAEHGSTITDALGNLIETGGDTSGVYSHTFLPGEAIPDYTIYPPDGLNIMGTPQTVLNPTRLRELVGEKMGPVDLAVCPYDATCPTGKLYHVDGIFDQWTGIFKPYERYGF